MCSVLCQIFLRERTRHEGYFSKQTNIWSLPVYGNRECVNYQQLKSVRTLLKITRLAYRKSYLVIICNSHDQLTKSEIMSSWSQFEHCSKSLVYPIGSHIWPFLGPNSHEKLTKYEIRLLLFVSIWFYLSLFGPNTNLVHI